MTHTFVDPMSYLFGNILLFDEIGSVAYGGLDAIILGVILLGYNAFVAVCFDEEFAKLRGLNTAFLHMLISCSWR
jgi:zinc transport system permease protein